MPYVDNAGVHIHYEVEGDGSPVLLVHPFSGSLDVWRDLGYVEGLRHRHEAILLDLRGHGQSDKPHDPPSYDRQLMLGDCIAVLDELHIAQVHFPGYSMGGGMG